VTGADVDAAILRLRLGAAAVALGIADAAADAALRYCANRKQFGGPLTDLATVRESLFLAKRDASSSVLGALEEKTLSAERACAMVDAACETAIEATARALQLHGGYGYLVEYDVERLLRDAVSLRAACDASGCRQEGSLALVTNGSRHRGRPDLASSSQDLS
jgi:alkylation response protein AidB-like acyl-CoA dehydrogenase